MPTNPRFLREEMMINRKPTRRNQYSRGIALEHTRPCSCGCGRNIPTDEPTVMYVAPKDSTLLFFLAEHFSPEEYELLKPLLRKN